MSNKTTNKNVIPKAGQVWVKDQQMHDIESFDGVIIHARNRETKVGAFISAEWLHANSEFVPQTDLEWLAVNYDENKELCARFNLVPYYSLEQIQQCRNELYGTADKSVVDILNELKESTGKTHNAKLIDGVVKFSAVDHSPRHNLNCPCSLTPVIKEKPIYTQAMVDNDETPEEGVLCEGFVLAKSNLLKGKTIAGGTEKGKWVTGSVIGKAYADNGGYVMLFKSECGRVYVMSSEYRRFRPIDNRTDEEKEAAQYINEYYKENETADLLIEEIKAGKIHGVKWVGE